MTGKVKPISPNEVTAAKAESLPDFVISAFNDMIGKNWDGHKSKFNQKDVVALIIAYSPVEITSPEVYANRYLDVEDVYQSMGWDVKYVKPDYTENFPAYFVFKK